MSEVLGVVFDGGSDQDDSDGAGNVKVQFTGQLTICVLHIACKKHNPKVLECQYTILFCLYRVRICQQSYGMKNRVIQMSWKHLRPVSLLTLASFHSYGYTRSSCLRTYVPNDIQAV